MLVFRLLVGVILFTFPVISTAQNLSNFADSIDLSKKSRFYKRLTNTSKGYNRDKYIINSDTAKVSKIFLHVKGDSGIPIGDETPISQSIEISSRDLETVSRQADIITNEIKGRFNRYTPLNRCTKSSIERIKRVTTESNFPKIDVLFAEKSDLEAYPSDYFGSDVAIYNYSRDRNNPSYYAAHGYGADCVPFRVQITDSHIIEYRGEKALKGFKKGS